MGLSRRSSSTSEYGNPQFTPNVIKLTNVTDSSIDVTFTVSKPDGAAAICTVDALDQRRVRAGHRRGARAGRNERPGHRDDQDDRPGVHRTGAVLPLSRLTAASEPSPVGHCQTFAAGKITPRTGTLDVYLRNRASTSGDHAVSTTNPETTWLSQDAYDRLAGELEELIAQPTARWRRRSTPAAKRATCARTAATTPPARSRASRRAEFATCRSSCVLRWSARRRKADKVTAGSVVTIYFDDDADDTETFLLGSREIAATTDLTVYSPESAVGQAILGARAGDTVSYTAPERRRDQGDRGQLRAVRRLTTDHDRPRRAALAGARDSVMCERAIRCSESCSGTASPTRRRSRAEADSVSTTAGARQRPRLQHLRTQPARRVRVEQRRRVAHCPAAAAAGHAGGQLEPGAVRPAATQSAASVRTPRRRPHHRVHALGQQRPRPSARPPPACRRPRPAARRRSTRRAGRDRNAIAVTHDLSRSEELVKDRHDQIPRRSTPIRSRAGAAVGIGHIAERCPAW